MALNAPCSWLIPIIVPTVAFGGGGMVFRTAGAIAALLIGLGAGQALAQIYQFPPTYPPPHAYPPPLPPPLPPLHLDDDGVPYDPIVPSRPLPPAAIGPQVYDPPPPPDVRYGRRGPVYEEAELPPLSPGYIYRDVPPGYE